MFPPFSEIPFTYITSLAVVAITLTAFYYKPLYNTLVFHPYEVFRLKKVHTVFTSALIHTGRLHFLFNLYFYFIMTKDLEYTILEKKYAQISAKLICLLLLLTSVTLPNLITGWKQRENIFYTSAGLSGAVYGFTAFSIIYFPFEHLLKVHRFIPLHYGYQFALALVLITALSTLIFRQSKINHRLHLYALFIGIMLAIVFRPVLILEIIRHFVL